MNLVSNVCVKAFVSETTDKAHPGSWENSLPPRALLTITTWGQVEASRAFVFQRDTDDHPPLRTANCPGQECCSFFHLILPESQALTAPCLFPVIKSLAWKQKGRCFVRVWTRHLLRLPAIWIERPKRFSRCHCLLGLVVTGSPNVGVFSSFKITLVIQTLLSYTPST